MRVWMSLSIKRPESSVNKEWGRLYQKWIMGSLRSFRMKYLKKHPKASSKLIETEWKKFLRKTGQYQDYKKDSKRMKELKK